MSYMKYFNQVTEYYDVTADEIPDTNDENYDKFQLSFEEQDMPDRYRLLPQSAKSSFTVGIL